MKRMRQAIIGVFLGWLMLALSALPAMAAERGALFKLSARGHTMYLFGTMHVGLPDFYPLEPRIRNAVEHASVLALEIDPLGDPGQMAAAIQKYGTYDPRSSVGRDVPAQLKPRLEKALRAASLDPFTVAHLRPWLVAASLTMAEFNAQGCRQELSVDLHLAKLARAHKVPVLELESLETQLSLFGRLSPAQQWTFLEDTVNGIEDGRQRTEVRQVIDAWRTADKQALEKISAHAEQDTTVAGRFVQKVLLDERNGPMADKLVKLLAKKNNAVAAIGVLHLVGEKSVPNYMRKKGVKVERIY
ncbi:MAG: TraB/GumN family protein [Gammaproteobacteria bacterium]